MSGLKLAMTAAAIVFALLGAGAMAQAAYLPAKAALSQVLLKRAFEQAETGKDARPWSWADMEAIARVRIDQLGLDTVVLSEASGEAMAFAPGHATGSAAIGDHGVAVIAAHRDTHFASLKDIQAGDVIYIETPSEDFSYKVTHTEIVRWDASGIDVNTPGRRLALVTCYPFDAMTAGGPMRFVVWAEEI